MFMEPIGHINYHRKCKAPPCVTTADKDETEKSFRVEFGDIRANLLHCIDFGLLTYLI